MEIRIATNKELNFWWDNAIKNHSGDNAYVVWKESFVNENLSGKRKTFFAFDKGEIVGQCTLLLESDDKVMTGSGKGELIKLEIIPSYRNKGLATKIYNEVKKYAKSIGIKTLTIGVEPVEIRNMQIYFHWGFNNFLQIITETYPAKNEIEKGDTITVLCYSQNI